MSRLAWLGLLAAACQGPNVSECDGLGCLSAGHVAFQSKTEIYLASVDPGSQPRDLSLELDAVSDGTDGVVNVSADGAWLVFATSRFACDFDYCLAAGQTHELAYAALVEPGNALAHPTGQAAIASGGDLIVYPSSGGPHFGDLFATRRQAGGWSAPTLLTGSSTSDFALFPVISADGTKVLFDCAGDQYGASRTSICEVGVDGTGLRAVVAPTDNGGTTANDCNQAAYGANGTIVFESDWTGYRQIYATPPIAPVAPETLDDFSPCVLPDGRIVSMWIHRPGNDQGLQELKIMNGDGSNSRVFVENYEVNNIGIGCGL